MKISYADSFNDTTTSRNTYAYPTKIIDPANNYSEVKYRFDIGVNVWAKSPAPAGNTSGKETKRVFDSTGRLLKETLLNTGAYTRYQYFNSQVQTKVFTTVVDTNNNGADANDEVISETWTDGAGRSRRSKTELPNSTGGWSGGLIEYDILGQVARSSVPTEIDSNWNPAGDDYTRGWLWTYQKYDWKGRVVRKINTDGADSSALNASDVLISYDGCGCAGGQVTTIQSELVPRDDQPSVNARRTQKVYEDIQGRAYKTEVLNWDGTTPYTTTVQTFDGRDQITKTRQYAGSTSSPTFQDVTMSYDGFGRMKTRHYAVEDANAETIWSYNADDSVQQTVDPRGAITNFAYNSRGLIEQISYTPPASQTLIPDVSDVYFSYDALGNRTQMTDGTGTQIYNYDQLSRLTSETKTFTGLTGNFTIGYDYHIGGGLKSVTDPFNSTVNYTNDKTGRVTGVAGTAWAQNTTGSYAGNIKYRAWGAIKQLDYTPPNDTEQIKMDYDSRLRVNHYEYSSGLAQSGYLMRADFNYFADGRVQAKNDLLDDAWDRTMLYDFAGRLTDNQFNREYGATGKRVYDQVIAYDAFSQMTSRQITHWDNDGGGFIASYVNGRKQDGTLTFDAAGNIIASDNGENRFQRMTFDASGRRAATVERWHTTNGPHATFIVWENKTEQLVDGDGRPVVEKVGQRRMNQTTVPPLTTAPRTYQIWSSVLGASLTEISNIGGKLETKVYAGGAVIAKQTRFTENNQNTDYIAWTSADSVTGTTGGISYLGNASGISKEEFEPLGQKIHANDPAGDAETTYQAHVGGAGDAEWQCQVPEAFYGGFQGMPEHCQMAVLMDFNRGLDDLYGSGRREANVKEMVDSPLPQMNSPTDKAMAYALSSSSKEFEAGALPSRSGQVKVEKVRKSSAPSLPDDFQDASLSGDDDWRSPFHFFSSDKKLSDEDCDIKMSKIFGGVAMAMENGDMRLSAPVSRSPHSARARNDLPATYIDEDENGKKKVKRNPDRGGIIHVYTDEKASSTDKISLYAPGGWIGNPIPYYTGGNSGLIFNYSGGISIEFVHVGTKEKDMIPTVPKNPGIGKTQEIGFVGGYGGTSSYGNYTHTHIVFFSNRAKNERIDPRVLFCGF